MKKALILTIPTLMASLSMAASQSKRTIERKTDITATRETKLVHLSKADLVFARYLANGIQAQASKNDLRLALRTDLVIAFGDLGKGVKISETVQYDKVSVSDTAQRLIDISEAIERGEIIGRDAEILSEVIPSAWEFLALAHKSETMISYDGGGALAYAKVIQQVERMATGQMSPKAVEGLGIVMKTAMESIRSPETPGALGLIRSLKKLYTPQRFEEVLWRLAECKGSECDPTFESLRSN